MRGWAPESASPSSTAFDGGSRKTMSDHQVEAGEDSEKHSIKTASFSRHCERSETMAGRQALAGSRLLRPPGPRSPLLPGGRPGGLAKTPQQSDHQWLSPVQEHVAGAVDLGGEIVGAAV